MFATVFLFLSWIKTVFSFIKEFHSCAFPYMAKIMQKNLSISLNCPLLSCIIIKKNYYSHLKKQPKQKWHSGIIEGQKETFHMWIEDFRAQCFSFSFIKFLLAYNGFRLKSVFSTYFKMSEDWLKFAKLYSKLWFRIEFILQTLSNFVTFCGNASFTKELEPEQSSTKRTPLYSV